MDAKTTKKDNIRVIRQRSNFFMVDNAIIDEYAPRIGATAFLVYCVLCRVADNADNDSFYSIPKIADRAGVIEATARKAIKTLESEGLISIEERHRANGSQSSNLYTILCITYKEPVTESAPTPVSDSIPRGGIESITPSYPNTPSSDTQPIKKEKPVGAVAPDLEPPQKASHQDMVAALCEVTGQDLTLSSIRGQILRTSKELREGGLTAADVRTVFAKGGWWYSTFWKGVKGEKPSIRDVVTQIKEGLAVPAEHDMSEWAVIAAQYRGPA